MSVGRISGPLLKANLLRDGVDLAFENDLLYLDVNNLRVGINTNAPSHDLHVDGTTRTTYARVDNQLDVGNITINGNTITSNVPTLNLIAASDGVIYQNRLTIDQIDIQDNFITTNTTNADLEIRVSGTGTLKVYSDMFVDGNIHATGNITADGSITLGDQDTDNIVFNADINSDIVPNITDTYDLGSASKRWNSIWTNNFIASNVLATNVIVNGVDVSQIQGNIIYVSSNGDNNNGGFHQNDCVATIEHALSLATAGDTVYVYPGTYEEDCPLIIPIGVTLKGVSTRNTIIKPVTSDPFRDVILLNGETTIEDLTITDFYYDSLNNKGYAFKLNPNFKVTTRSPYIRNVSVISKGTVTSAGDPRGFDQGDAGRGAYLDGSIANPTTNEVSVLFHSVTFICPNADAVVLTEGLRVEWINCFTYFANRGIYAYMGTSGKAGIGQTILAVDGVTGTYNIGDTIEYYAEDHITLLASGVIADISGSKIYISGRSDGFVEYTTRVGKPITFAGFPQISTAQSKFGGASVQFVSSTNDELNVAANDDFAFGTSDFTIEFWIYFNPSANLQCILDMRSSAAAQAAITLDVDAAGNVRLYVQGAYRISSGSTLADNTWHHIAVVRNSGTTSLYVNGTPDIQTYADSNTYNSKPLNVGAYYNSSSHLDAYIDELRITKGVARYTSSFVVPTSSFGSDSNTVLLVHFDGINGSTNFVDDSTLIQDIRFTPSGATATEFVLVDYADFGAEIRSIGSACVYGNYAIVGDGPGVVMNLIGHNVSYIGSGKDQSNNALLTIHANEFVSLNGAKIHYTSVNEHGDFRVGDLFSIDQETGVIQFTNSIINILGASGITLTDGTNVTIINPTKVETGDIRISGNLIESLTDEVNINAANNTINLLNNVNISGNLDVTGNVTIGGNITVGDQTTDSVQFIAGIDSDLIPNLSATYNVGEPSLQWKDLWVRTAHISDIEINTNYIRTTVSNTDLELRANGTGSILVEDIRVNQNVISTDSGNIQVTPATTLDITASTTNINGDFHVTGNVSIDTNTTLGTDNTDNVIFYARVNTDIVPSITSAYDLGSSTRAWKTAYLSSSYIDDILIDTNIIQTINSNSNLELRANGTGSIQAERTYFNENLIYTVGENLLIQPATTLDITASTTNVNGDFHVTGNTELDSNTVLGTDPSDDVVFNSRVNSNIVPKFTSAFDLGSPTKAWRTAYLSSAYIDDILIDTNIIQTINSNSNLELRANGTGSIALEQTYVNENLIYTIGNNLLIQPATTLDITASTTNVNGDFHVTGNTELDSNTVLGTDPSDDVVFNSRVNSNIIPKYPATFDLGSSTKAWRNAWLSSARVDDIYIDTNIITTTASNANLELRANGTGAIRIEKIDINENLIKTNGTDNLLIQPATTLDITASTTTVNGDLHITGNSRFDGNIDLGTDSTDNIVFNARVNSNIEPNYSGVYNLGSPTKNWRVAHLSSAFIDNIYIDTNIITTTASNANLELRANGTGAIRVEQVDINENVISTNGSTNLILDPATTLDIFADTNITGDLNVTGNVTIGGNITVGNQDTDNITFTAEINSDIIPNIPVTYNLGSAAKRWKTLFAENTFISDIEINTNVIRTTVSNADLELRANGTGGIKLEDITVNQNIISVASGTNIVMQPSGTGVVDINTTQAIRIPRGTTAERPGTPLAGMIRYNTDNSNYEGYDGTYWRVINGLYDVDQNTYLIAEATPGSNNNTFYFVANGVQIADMTATRLNAVRVEVDDIFVDGNTIGSINNQTIQLTAAGTGTVKIEDFAFKNNTITNTVSNGITEVIHSGTGYFKIAGTTGFRVPVGTAVQRPDVTGNPSAFVGFTRYNTDDDRLEIFDGVTWQSAAGTSSGITVAQAEDVAIQTVLMLG